MAAKQRKNRGGNSAKKKMPNGKPFKPGQSGNPNGRPPKVKCIPDLLEKIGKEDVESKDGEQVLGPDGKPLSKLEYVLRKTYEYARDGKWWAVQFIAERTEGKAIEHVELQTDMTVSFEGREDEAEG